MLDESTSNLVLALLGVLFGLVAQALTVISFKEYQDAVFRAADRKLSFGLDPSPRDPLRQLAEPYPAKPEPLIPATTLLSELALYIALVALSGLFRPGWSFLVAAVVTYGITFGLIALANSGKIPSQLPGMDSWFA